MLNYKFKKLNKKGQSTIGETLTWFIATVIIVVVILVFVWISFLMSKVKAVNIGDVTTDLGKNSEQLTMKTTLAEQLGSNVNRQEVDSILKEQNGG